MRDTLVPVKKAGKGPTEKSHKFRVVVGYEDREVFRASERTFTLPWFAIQEFDGDYFAQIKFVNEHAAKYGEMVPPSHRAFSCLLAQIKECQEKDKAEKKAAAAEYARRAKVAEAESAKRRAEAEAARQAETDSEINLLQPKIKQKGDNAIAFCIRHFSSLEMSRKLKMERFDWSKIPSTPLEVEKLLLPQLKLIEKIIRISETKNLRLAEKILDGATVKISEWNETMRYREEISFQGCVVKYYGTKRVIICSDGTEFVKLETPSGYLQIIGGVERQRR